MLKVSIDNNTAQTRTGYVATTYFDIVPLRRIQFLPKTMPFLITEAEDVTFCENELNAFFTADEFDRRKIVNYVLEHRRLPDFTESVGWSTKGKRRKNSTFLE